MSADISRRGIYGGNSSSTSARAGPATPKADADSLLQAGYAAEGVGDAAGRLGCISVPL